MSTYITDELKSWIGREAIYTAPEELGQASIRYFAMVVFAVTTAKVFFVDLAELDRIYRVMSVIGLGILLLLTSWLYQRSRSEGGLNSEG